MRLTAVWSRPVAAAMERVDQWVASAGCSSSVLTITRSTSASVIFGGRPGLGPCAVRRGTARRSAHATFPPSAWCSRRARRSPCSGALRRPPGRSGTAAPGPEHCPVAAPSAPASPAPRHPGSRPHVGASVLPSSPVMATTSTPGDRGLRTNDSGHQGTSSTRRSSGRQSSRPPSRDRLRWGCDETSLGAVMDRWRRYEDGSIGLTMPRAPVAGTKTAVGPALMSPGGRAPTSRTSKPAARGYLR